MLREINTWFREWMKENTLEKLLSLMLAAIIIVGFVSREFYKQTMSNFTETITYLKNENSDCQETVKAKDDQILRMARENVAALMKIKFDITKPDTLTNE